MRVRHLFGVLTLASLTTGCESQFSFQELFSSCEPPKSSARYGKNQGPVILSPDSYQPFSSTLKVSGTCVDGEPLILKGRGLVTQVETMCNGGQFTENVSFTDGDGEKELDVTQATFDAAKTEEVLDRRCFLKDTVPPKVLISGSNSAAALNRTTTIVSGVCEKDLDVNINGPYLVAPVTTACTNGRFSAPISFTGGDGIKDIVATQVDRAGNSGKDDESYMTDFTAPVVTIDSPRALTLTNASVTLTGTCEYGPPVIIEGETKSKIVSATCNQQGRYTADVELSMGDGVKNLRASQTDIAGNVGRDNRDFMKDDTPPRVVITEPTSGTITSDPVLLLGTCETGLTVRITGDLTASTNVSCANGMFTKSVTLSTPDGIKNVKASQTDLAGNSGYYERNFKLDKTSPIVRIDSPAANSNWTTASTLSGICESGLSVTISGTGLSLPAFTTCPSGRFSTKLIMSPGDGIKSIQAKQTDSVGNIGQDTRNFTVDTTAPDLAITGPDENSSFVDALTLVGKCETGLEVQISGTGISSPAIAECKTSRFSAALLLSPNDGTKNIVVTQTDMVGNIAKDSRNFIKDSTAPIIKITNPSPGAITSGAITLSGICETGLGVHIKGDLKIPTDVSCTAGAFSASIQLSGADGQKNIVVSQTDTIGNSNSDNRNFILDSSAPAISITGPAAGTIDKSGVNLSGTCESGLMVQISGSGVNTPTMTSCSAGKFSTAITFSNGDGVKNVIASQTDTIGNSASDNRNFAKDTTVPIIKITSPAPNTLSSGAIALSGTCETGLTISISGDISNPGSHPCIAGAFSTNVNLSGADGPKNIVASQTDAVGNFGSDNRNFILDSSGPAISITSPAAGTISKSGITLTGTCENGLQVRISGSGVNAASTASCSSGTFSTAIVFSNGDGTKNVIASQTDSIGNSASDNRNFIKDSSAPAVKITSPLAGTYTTGPLVVSGTCESDLMVSLTGDLVAAASVSCNGSSFTANLTLSGADGVKNVNASQTDSVGNTGNDSRSFVLDSSAPAIAITGPAVGAIAKNGLTLVGSCESGLTVSISGAGVSAPSTANCVAGAFSSAIIFSNGDGSKNIIASQTDKTGNIASDNRNFIKDSTAPKILITSPISGTTYIQSATIEGTCESGLPVQISGSGVKNSSTTDCILGSFSAANVLFSNGDGSKNILASQTDLAGNVGSDSVDLMRDSTVPALAITGPAAGTIAKNGVTLVGTCETGLTVNISGSGVNTTSTANCVAGAFSSAIIFSSGDGSKNVIASQTDSVGNSASDNRNFAKDSTAPVIKITSPAAGSTSSGSLVLSGTCESGLLVSISGDLSNPGTTPCNANTFSTTITLSGPSGTKNIVVSQTDTVGNIGNDNRNFNLDNTAPSLAITGPAAGTIAKNGVTLVGTCEAGLTVNISGSGVNTASTANCVAGAFSTAVTYSNDDGTKNIIASQTDSVGNSASDNRNFVKDATAPVIKITSPAAGTSTSGSISIAGTCETGLMVSLSGALTAPGSTPCTSGGFSTTITLSGSTGSKNIVASQTDAVGNSGSDNRNFSLDNTAPSLAITGPAAGTIAKNGVTLVGTCESGLTVNISGTGLNATSTANCVAGAFSSPITFSSGDGSKNVIASQTDSVGNSASDNRNFEKDSTAPAIKITSPIEGTSTAGSISIAGTCESGLMVSLSGDITTPGTTTCTSGAFSTTITLAGANGAKNLVASQTDSVGNTGSDSRSFSLSAASGYDTFISKGPGGKVDILFVDDNSASMDAEQAALGSKFSSFTAALSSVDWQAGIITTDCTAGSPHNYCGQLHDLTGRPAGEYILKVTTPDFLNVFKNTIQRPETIDCLLTASCPSGREEGLKSAITAMDLRNTDNVNFFRPDSDLALVFLSDEDESSSAPPTATTPAQLLAKFNSIWGNTKKISSYSIIVKPGDLNCLTQQKQQLGANANYGTYFDNLSSLTGGISVSICEPDYSVTMTQIGEDVTRLSNSVDLSNTPISGTVSVVFTPAHNTGWSVSGDRITFDIPAPFGTKVEIFYEY